MVLTKRRVPVRGSATQPSRSTSWAWRLAPATLAVLVSVSALIAGPSLLSGGERTTVRAQTVDSDGDGCTDAQELGADALAGGLRDPGNFWDFFDTPDATNVRDRAVNAADLQRLVDRFGAAGVATTVVDALAPPSAAGYHAAFDRGAPLSGDEPWDLTPADGVIAAGDVFYAVGQFGHTCAPSTAQSQPAAPIHAAFFYPWFANAWDQGGVFPYTNFTPSLGYYDSQNDATIDAQLQLAKRAHLEAFIASWWGPGHHTDAALQHIADRTTRAGSPYPEMRWSIYYEAEGYGDPGVSQLVADLQYLDANLLNHPAFLRVDGRPVVFIWADGADACGMADRWAQAKAQLGGDLFVVLKVFPGYAGCANQPDSWHQYGPAVAYDAQGPYSATVSPGFWKKGEAPRLDRDPGRFEADVRRMAASGAFWQLVTAWNEWGEGTSVEPAQEFGETYIDILCRNVPGPAPCAAGGPTPTPPSPGPTSTPTRTPTPGPTGTPTRTPTPGPTRTPTRTPTPGPTRTPTPATTPTSTPTSPPGGDPVLVGAGDISDCGNNNDEATARLLDGIAGTVFTTGDNVYESGSAAQFTSCYEPTWGRHKARTRPVPGNHDYGTSNASGYFGYFGAPACATAVYCAYNLGDNWRVYQLNSEISHGAGSTQEQWLRADLAANPRACVAALWHKPRFSSGANHGSDSSYQALWQALYDFGADLVLVGHEHNYERFAPQTAGGALDTTRGIREFVVGTGGRSHYGFGSPLANSEVRNGDTFGVLKLTLHASSYDWQFVPVAGASFTDTGSTACH